MLFRQIEDPKLAQYAYLVGCQRTGEALIIDPQRDIDRYIRAAERERLQITAVAETHIHADYLSGLREFSARGVPAYVSDEGDADWKYEWANDPAYDVRMLKDGDTFTVGNITFRALHTPGHTPEHIVFLITDHGGGGTEPIGIVSGDFVFVGDLGRPDLLETAAGVQGKQDPSARELFRSVQRFLELPDFLQLWPGHGAGSACGKALGAVPQSTVGYERRFNTAISAAAEGENAFVKHILEGQPEPPRYFARMKRLNKEGPPLLNGLPRPKRVSPHDLQQVLEDKNLTPLDARLDRIAFMRKHLPGSLYAPFNRTFNTAAGSVLDANASILLVIDEAFVEEAVRDLIRIGYDDIPHFITPDDLDIYFSEGGASASIPRIDFEEIDARRSEPGHRVLDVRNASEYQNAHLVDATQIAYTRLAGRLEDVPGASTLLVHCAGGARSAVAAALLARTGHDVIYVDGTFRPLDALETHPE